MRSPGRPVTLLLAATTLGLALESHGLSHSTLAFTLLTLSLLLTLASLFPPYPFTANHFAFTVLLVVLFGQFFCLFWFPPALYLDIHWTDELRPFQLGLAVAAIATLGILAGGDIMGRASFILLLIGFAFAGAWIIRRSPHPTVDVLAFQRDGGAAILAGQNPYTISFPNPYPRSDLLYDPSLWTGNRLNFGYPYLPLTLYPAALADALHIDVRYTNLAALLGSAALIAFISPTRWSRALAALFLTTPRIFLILEHAWVEPFVLLALAATVFCLARRWRLTLLIWGLFLASKQYAVLALPLTGLLLPHWPWKKLWRPLLFALLTAAVVTLPLALWNFPAFWRSAVTLQIRQPFRPDSLSYLAAGLGPSYLWLAWAGLILGLLASLALAPRTPAGLALAVALSFVLFFAFNKQAFANYYLLILGCLCLAAAAETFPPAPRPLQNEPKNEPNA